MFLIGQGQRTIVIGPTESHYCPHCETQTDFIPQLRYSYGKFDVLFGFVYNKRYQLACAQCNHGWILDTRQTERSLPRHPLPFRLRYGWLIMAGAMTGLALAVYAYRHGS